MKIAWIQDLNIFSIGGGAQLTDLGHFKEGLRRGYDIRLVLPDSDAAVPFGCDLVIASNCVNFSTDFFQELIKKQKPIIWFFHDYFCKWRLFFPMLEKCHNCYLKPRWLPILTKSPLLIWLSPLHRESWLWTYPELAELPYVNIPSAIDPNQFTDLGMKREGVVCSSGLLDFKGRTNVLRWAREHPDTQITFLGGNDHPMEPLPLNCKDIGYYPHMQMNDVFNQFVSLLHLPNTPQPFERIIAEAYLGGCKITGNHLVGALSYDWFTSREKVAEYVRRAPADFWDSIEKALERDK